MIMLSYVAENIILAQQIIGSIMNPTYPETIQVNASQTSYYFRREIETGKVSLDILRRVSLCIRPNGTASRDPPGKSKPLLKKYPLGFLTANPPVFVVPTAGGTFTHQLINSANHKLVFKVKSSNNKEYRIKPVYGFIQPGALIPLKVGRTEGRCSEDKLVILYGPAPVKSMDVNEAFKATNPTGNHTT